MSWLALAIKAAGAIGSLATLGSVLSATSVISESGLPKFVSSKLNPTQTGTIGMSTQDVIKAAETQATYTQKVTGLDNPQNSGVVGLPAKTGTDPLDSRLAAALAALGLGGAAAGAAIGIQRLRGRGKRRRRYARRGYGFYRRHTPLRRRRYGGFRRRRGYGRPRYGRRWGGRRF